MSDDAIRDRLTSCEAMQGAQRCRGRGWFALTIHTPRLGPLAPDGSPATRQLCAPCASRELRELQALGAAFTCCNVVLRCPRCGSLRSHADAAREWCSRCGYEHPIPG